MMSNIALKKNLQEMLENRGWSVYQLEKKVGVSKQQSIQNIFRGTSKNPSIELVYGISRALNVSIEELLIGQEDTSINNYGLFADVCAQVINEIKSLKNLKISPKNLFSIIEEVYLYSTKMNCDTVDQTFAKWTVMKYYNP